LKAEQAAKKDSKKRARDDAQIGSDGLKSGGGSSSSSSSSSGSDGSSSSSSGSGKAVFLSLFVSPWLGSAPRTKQRAGVF
jgi:hypothetical protein